APSETDDRSVLPCAPPPFVCARFASVISIVHNFSKNSTVCGSARRLTGADWNPIISVVKLLELVFPVRTQGPRQGMPQEELQMKYVPMQTGMWAVFAGSFRKNLEAVFDLDPKTAGAVTAAAKKQYRRILRELPDFEKATGFS
ncbi:MAG: hypothetical protein SOV41_01535, partial [Oscillospiraceae bacterium]|nr:hypothetical protein [Oscillospiraceae bacterium]